MHISIKTATLAALAAASVSSEREGLSLSEYNSILQTDVESVHEETPSDSLWKTLTEQEWSRATKVESSHDDDLSSSVRRVSRPYVVCSSGPHSGNVIRASVEKHFGTTSPLLPLHNSEEKTCFLLSSPASIASSAPEDFVVQPHFAAMKMARGAVRSLRDETHRGRLEVTLCPGTADTISDAATVTAEIFTARNDDDDDGVAIDTARKLAADDDDDDENCSDVFPVIEGGYKGESAQIELPDGTSPSCLRSVAAVLSASPRVCYVQVSHELKFLNHEAQWILQSGVEESRPWFDAGLDGTGQVVAVSDSGLDMDNCYFLDATGNVNKWGRIESEKRKVIQYKPTRGFNDDAMIGHGTHVAGTVAGRRAVSGKEESTGVADGMARGAKIAMMDVVIGPIVLPPFQINELFTPGQKSGAKIHSASWGSAMADYDVRTRGFDQWTYDNPDFLTIVAAGNSGMGCNVEERPCPPDARLYNVASSLLSPGNAKNIISVGATESAGPELNLPDMMGYEYLAYFSSRGPTSDGRTKPDVVAPGYNIISAESHGRAHEYSCDGVNNGTKYMAGTSMAAPAVSGIAALVRQYFEEGWYPTGDKTEGNEMNPSAALVKAVLTNGAQYLKGVNNFGEVTDTAPYDDAQNFGRVNMMDSLYLSKSGNNKLYVVESSVMDGEKKFGNFTTSLSDECSSPLLSVSLVWTDVPGFPGCTRCLMNDLDLHVIKVLGEGEQMGIFPNGLEAADTINNAERIQTTVEDGEKIGVVVSGTNMVTDVQDYALVVTGCFTVDE